MTEPLPAPVRITVEIYMICEQSGIRGCLVTRRAKLPEFGAELTEAQAQYALSRAGYLMMKKARLMTAAEVTDFLKEKEN